MKRFILLSILFFGCPQIQPPPQQNNTEKIEDSESIANKVLSVIEIFAEDKLDTRLEDETVKRKVTFFKKSKYIKQEQIVDIEISLQIRSTKKGKNTYKSAIKIRFVADGKYTDVETISVETRDKNELINQIRLSLEKNGL